MVKEFFMPLYIASALITLFLNLFFCLMIIQFMKNPRYDVLFGSFIGNFDLIYHRGTIANILV